MPRFLFLATLFSLSATTIALAEAVELPTGFDGVYVAEGETCGSGLDITVEKGVMLVMDGSMSVSDLIEDPQNPRRVEATLEMSGGGGEWTDSAVLTLADDEQSLRFDYADGTVITWFRCD